MRSTNTSGVISALRMCGGLPAYITPPKDGWITVYPQATESLEQPVVQEIVAALSAGLNAAAFGFVLQDSEVFTFVLAKDGQIADEYDSTPNYYRDGGVGPKGGDPAHLLDLCKPGTSEEALVRLLHHRELSESHRWDSAAVTMPMSFWLVARALRLLGAQAGPTAAPYHGQGLAAGFASLLAIPPERALNGFQFFAGGGPAGAVRVKFVAG